MSFDKAPRSNRIHIAILGRMNSGKSSLINTLADQDVAVVSPMAGTTTDIVYKSMEIHGTGPVVFIDTPGVDDDSLLSEARVARTMRAINKADMAVVVVDAELGEGEPEAQLYSCLERKRVPYIVAVNKTDLCDADCVLCDGAGASGEEDAPRVCVSARTGRGKEELLGAISRLAQSVGGLGEGPPIVGDLVSCGDMVVLVIPADAQAPKGRLILPQVQTIRDVLDHEGIAVAVRIDQLRQLFADKDFLPRLVVTDSQAFGEVAPVVPESVPMTSFSILFARHKGDFELLVEGARAIEGLEPGDVVLISEACTHHPIEDDIGTVKIPRLLNAKVGGELRYEWQRGGDFPEDLDRFKLVINCGGCMLNRREMCSRLEAVADAAVPVTNYGMAIAACLGILPRALRPFAL